MEIVKDRIKAGVVGLGLRGMGQLEMLLDAAPDVEITCVCDTLEFRVKRGLELVKEKRGADIRGYNCYKKMLGENNFDAVFIFTSWTTHAKIAVAAMKAGAYAAMEVGGAASVDECWQLVHASEDTGMPCMMLENANYGKKYLAVLRMVKEGLFGELIHCAGGYQHDLRDEIGLGREIHHYRHDNFMNRNAELYPTHEIGPMAKMLNINRGNRFVNLVSMATKARGLEEYYKKSRRVWSSWVADELKQNYDGEPPENIKDYDLIGKRAACGDVVTTLIRCAGGETCCIVHDCTLPRPRLSNFRVQGTNGIWMDDAKSIYFEGISEKEDVWEADAPYIEKYEHPLWAENARAAESGPSGGFGSHGGTDFIVMRGFIDAVKRRTQTPIDVYDTASWMAITALSEDSIAAGSAVMPFPDFTNGAWMHRESAPKSKHSLDAIHWDLFE